MDKATSPRSEADPPSEDVLRRIRVPFIRRAALSWEGRDEEVFVVDLGLAGVFIERAAPLPIGAAVEIRFEFPDNEIPVVALCRVAWCRAQAPPGVSSPPPGAGLEFASVASADQARIRQYLAEYYRREPRSRRFVSHEEDR